MKLVELASIVPDQRANSPLPGAGWSRMPLYHGNSVLRQLFKWTVTGFALPVPVNHDRQRGSALARLWGLVRASVGAHILYLSLFGPSRNLRAEEEETKK